MWAVTTWSFCRRTRNVVFGRVSTTSPSIWIASSLAITSRCCSGNRADCAAAAPHAQLNVAFPPHGHAGVDESGESRLEVPARDVAAAEAREVRARHLAVDQGHVPCPALRDEAREGDLRSVRFAREHGFSKERPPESYAIEAADQAPRVPGLEGMCEPAAVQEHVGLVHLSGDPGAGHALPRAGAGLDDGSERGVHAGLVAAFADRARKAARDP